MNHPINADKVRTLLLLLTCITGIATLPLAQTFAQEQLDKIKPSTATSKTNAAEIAEPGALAQQFYQRTAFAKTGDKGAEINAMQKRFLTGAAVGDQFGYSVASAGDVNGDGFSDVIIGASFNDSGGLDAGRAYIYYGGMVMDAVADVILTGGAADDRFGVSVAGAGDINGDGFSDVIVGAYFNDAGGTNAGRAYVYYGGMAMNTIADVILTGGVADDRFGTSVAGAADVNGDGFSDVIVGAYLDDAGGLDAGRAFVYFGGVAMNAGVDAILTGEAAGDAFGISVASAGDINGDGLGDMIVGAYLNDAGGTNAGRAFLYLNSLTGTDIPDWTITGEAVGDQLGNSVASAGDVNGDGFSDVIVGAENAGRLGLFQFGAGRAYVYVSSSPPIVPSMIRISDVPFDQGGKVTVHFARSGYDIIGIAKITDYLIQRSLPPGVSCFAWEHIATFPATRDPIYSHTASTLYDSSANTAGEIFFRVIARTANPLESWKSRPLAGYSVDNLAPVAVKFFTAEIINGAAVKLTWNPNTIDSDVKHFKVHRSTEDGFAPHPDFEIATTTDTTFLDSSPIVDENNYYLVVTIDIHGNSSIPSPQASVILTTVTEKTSELPTEFALGRNYPNPFNPTTSINFAVPKHSMVHIKIIDVLGKEVMTLVEKEFEPGLHKVSLNAAGLTSGVYFYRMEADGFSQSRKLTIVR